MKVNIKYIIFVLLLSYCTFVPNVFADVTIIDREKIQINNQTVYKVYDNLATGEKNIRNTTGAIVKLDVDGTEYAGYCIDFGVSISAGTTASTLDLYKYYEAVIGETEAKELVNKIVQYTKFGYGSNGKTSEKYYLATQQLIWEAINDTGFYQSDFYEGRAGKKLNIENLGWTIDKETRIDIAAEINSIKNDINNYYKIPSLCSSQNKLEIEIGENAEFIDNNNVLSSYQVTCDSGLECTREGNKLKVIAKSEAGAKKITFTKPSSGTENIIYRSGSQQGIVINTGILESVSCEFGINSFQNVKTSDIKIVYIAIAGLFCGTVGYVIYNAKRS